MTQASRVIGVVVAGEDELEAIQPGLDLLDACAVPHEIFLASPQLMPDELRDWARSARDRGLQAILAAGGVDARLPATLAAHTILPVIAIPLETGPSGGGMAAGDRALQSSEGIPIAITSSPSPRNAAMFAIEILARFDPRWEASILKYRAHLKERFLDRAEAVRSRHQIPGEKERHAPAAFPEPEGAPPPLSAPLPASAAGPTPGRPASDFPSEPVEAGTQRPPETEGLLHTTKPGLKREPQYVGRIRIDSELLAIDVAENATDCLLDGGIVALPTDTVYGLAVDATNPDAVESLYDLKGRDADKPVAVFIESQKQLAALVKTLTPEIRHMLEAFWPGPLTVVFERRSKDFDYLAPGSTLGVRLPDHSIALALLQELRRPIACTSANPSGAPPARSGDEVEQYFGPDVHMILDVGKLPPSEPSTVIDVTREPYRLLREGPITRSQLSAVLGDLLESDEGD